LIRKMSATSVGSELCSSMRAMAFWKDERRASRSLV
jgi:hypothetical protein